MASSCRLGFRKPYISVLCEFRTEYIRCLKKDNMIEGDKGSAYIITFMIRSTPPPPGFYVPAVLFFDKNEDLDIPSIQAHVLRLAQVSFTALSFFFPNLIMTGWCDWDSSSRIQWRGPASVACLHPFPVVRSQAITLDRTMNATRPSH